MTLSRRMKITALSASVAAAALVTGVTFAQPDDMQQQRGHAMREALDSRFSALDQNEDGKITAEEIAARRTERFAQADKDGDGALSASELEQQALERIRPRIERRLARLDKDESGGITEDEMPAGRRGDMISRLDQDGDGAVTREEIRSRMQEMRGRMARHHHDGGQEQKGE